MMKFYNSIGPNPGVVKMFMAEKSLNPPRVEIDLMGGENRQAPYTAKNPAGQTPALELDDGVVLCEITAICEYLDEIGEGPSLIGDTAEERAITRMWTRRVDINVCEPLTNGFRYSQGLALFQSRMRTLPQAADDLKLLAKEKLAWLDGLIAGRAFIAGDKISLADILLFVFLGFGAQVGQPLDPANKNLTAWFERMAARPSAAAAA
ncbi:MAG TPA: glutathione S-transferase family protein [Caulobacteraceae bacterium]|jgi:glutathione S-transferase